LKDIFQQISRNVSRHTFSSDVVLLVLPALPCEGQVAWLLIVVYYLPQLAPESDGRSTSENPWQLKESFKADYSRVKGIAVEFGNRLGTKCEGFFEGLEQTEKQFLKLCAEMHALEKKAKNRVTNMHFHEACRSFKP
jgi:hypothetical protein